MKFLLLGLLLLNSKFSTATTNAQLRETLYQDAVKSIINEQSYKTLILTPFEQEIFVDALWDLIEENNPKAQELLNKKIFFQFDLEERFRLELIDLKANGKKLSQNIIDEVSVKIQSKEASLRLIYLIASYENELVKENLTHLIEDAKEDERFQNVSKQGTLENPNDLKDLLDFNPSTEGLRVYLICRSNRLYSCLLIMKDENHELVLNEDGTTWTHQGLALSSRGLPSHQRNGNTPAGVWRINSVMPEANEQLSFGKYRRLILEFLNASEDESEIKSKLPASSHNLNWWIPSAVARDVGRNDFRIHGSGRMNKNPESSYFPFIRTAGCIAQRENTYQNITYKDQRVLLDKMMEALKLDVNFENETLIQGILYLIELDNEMKPVTIADLQEKGIL